MDNTEVRSPTAPTLRGLPSTVVAMALRSAGVLAIMAVPAVSGLGSVDPGGPGERADRQHAPMWKASYSERYPGCVPSVLWPADESPVALVTRSPDGHVAKVAVDAQTRPLQAVPDDAWTIGACR